VTVIHTAAIVSGAASLDQAWEVNARDSRRVLGVAEAHGVRRFVHLSSVAAYGFDFPDNVDEMYPIRVNGFSYTDTKVNSEAVVLAAHGAGEIECTIVRPVDVFGPGSVPWVVLPLRMIKKGQMLLPNGGKGVFSPAYIDNFVDGMVLAISSDAAAGQIFILGDGYGVSCSHYFGRLASIPGGEVRTLPTGIAIAIANVIGFTQPAGPGKRAQCGNDTDAQPAGYVLDRQGPQGARIRASRQLRRGHAPRRGLGPDRRSHRARRNAHRACKDSVAAPDRSGGTNTCVPFWQTCRPSATCLRQRPRSFPGEPARTPGGVVAACCG